MTEFERQIRTRFLDKLDQPDFDDEDPRLDFGSVAMPYFIEAFEKEANPQRRARLVRIIWQFRELAAMATLADAIDDSNAEVWKEAQCNDVFSLFGEWI